MFRYESVLVNLTPIIWSNIPSLWIKKHNNITWDTSILVVSHRII